MARYYCKQCEIFVDDNKIARKHHEDSSKHKSSVLRSISKLHQKNRDLHRQKVEADKEQRKINKELGIKSDWKPEFKKEAKKVEVEIKEVGEEDVAAKEPNIGEWSVVEKTEVANKEEESRESNASIPTTTSNRKKQLSAADLETKNWNITSPKKIDLSDSDEDTKKPISFKKRKIKNKPTT